MVAIIAFYLIVCTVRMTMPGIEPRDRNLLFGLRVLFLAVGVAIAYGFMYVVYISRGHFFRDPFYAQRIAELLAMIVVAIGEYVTRRKLRSLNIFPRNKKIPWTY